MQTFHVFLGISALSLGLLGACGGEPSQGSSGSGGDPTGGGGAGAASSASSTSGTSTSSGASGSSSSGGQGGGAQGTDLSMLSLNLHCLRLDGTVYATNTERFAAIAKLVADRNVAALALQEACKRPGENAIEMLRAAIEQATGATWTSAWGFAHVAWEGTPDQADEGVGLLVRGPLSSPDLLQLAVQGALHRVALSATLSPELGNVRLTSVHFEVFEAAAREGQAREAAAAALVATAPTYAAIVAGDFNDVEGSATFGAFPAMGYIASDAGLDPTGIDHVMVHRAANLRPMQVDKVFLGAEAVSDHPGIFVHFAKAPGDAVTTTRITANADPGASHFLSIRGNALPLTWNAGFPMHSSAQGVWTFVTTEIASDFEYKILIDDKTWQTGANVLGKAGIEQSVTPTF